MLTKTIQTRQGPLEYSDSGSGQPILYFHGCGVSGDVMLAVESRLIEDGFRLIVPNRPGYGATPLESGATAADCGSLMASLLDLIDLPQVSVMGSSAGAAFATAFAVTQPSRVQSLVLLCPQLHRWDDKRWLPKTSRWTLPFLRRPWLKKWLLAGYRASLRKLPPRKFLRTEAGARYDEFAEDDEALKLCEATLAAMTTGVRAEGFANDFTVFIDEDIIGEKEQAPFPVLLIHDECDPIASSEHVEWFAAKAPNCRVVKIHAAGHLIWVGPDVEVMHQSRIQFMREHAG